MKIITGIRRCGKSFLLRTLYKQALINNGVSAASFIEIDLEKGEFAAYRNPVTLENYVRERTKDKRKKFLWTDEDGVMYVGVIPFLLDNLADSLFQGKKG